MSVCMMAVCMFIGMDVIDSSTLETRYTPLVVSRPQPRWANTTRAMHSHRVCGKHPPHRSSSSSSSRRSHQRASHRIAWAVKRSCTYVIRPSALYSHINVIVTVGITRACSVRMHEFTCVRLRGGQLFGGRDCVSGSDQCVLYVLIIIMSTVLACMHFGQQWTCDPPVQCVAFVWVHLTELCVRHRNHNTIGEFTKSMESFINDSTSFMNSSNCEASDILRLFLSKKGMWIT